MFKPKNKNYIYLLRSTLIKTTNLNINLSPYIISDADKKNAFMPKLYSKDHKTVFFILEIKFWIKD